MNQTIRIKKGLDVPLGDEVQRTIVDARTIERYAVKPTDMVGFTPRLLVGDGDTVAAGQPLMADKNDPRITLPSPVDGVVEAIIRGEKRKLMEVVVSRDPKDSKGLKDSKTLTTDSPCWWMLRERPFGTIANPDHKPKGIYVSLRDTNPLAPDIDFTLKGREHELEAGVKALEAFAEVAT